MHTRFLTAGVLTLTLCLLAVPASAATLTVTNTNDSGPGSFRQALLDVNAGLGARIEFAIGSGHQVIQPTSPLPSIARKRVVIDGRTQPGYSGKPLIEIDGSLVPMNWWEHGLDLWGDVMGLVVNRFRGSGITMHGGSVRNCYLGTDHTGTQAAGNQTGIRVNYAIEAPVEQTVVGGTTSADRNLISANSLYGIDVNTTMSIQGNTFGGVGNSGYHVFVENASSSGTQIGTLAGNAFVGSDFGVESFYAERVVMKNNIFSGVRIAVSVYQSHDTLVENNTIENSSLMAIYVSGNSLRNRLMSNSLRNNYFGIDLGGCCDYGSPTPNDAGDGDTGPNNFMNFPVIESVTTGGGASHVIGFLNTAANRSVTIQLFTNQSCNAKGYGEGTGVLDTFSGTTDANGRLTFDRAVNALPAGTVVTATATSDLEGTSEFSKCAVAGASVENHGVFAFSLAEYSVHEGAVNATIDVARLQGTDGVASVDYVITPFTATAGTDYSAASGTLTFAAGQDKRKITISSVADDLLYEKPDETFGIQLINPTGGTSIGSYASTVVRIVDNDPEPALRVVTDLTVPEGNSDTPINVTARLSATAGVKLEYDYATAAGTAQAGSDFVSASGKVTFAPGETEKTIPLTIKGDEIVETDESFYLTFPGRPELRSTITIKNDDAPTLLSIADVTVTETDGSGEATLTVTSTKRLTAHVPVVLQNGTATEGQDFNGNVSEVVFDNELSKTFTIRITGDDEPETNETFTVKLLDGAAYDLDRGTATVMINNDDIGVGPRELWIAVGTSGKFTIDLGAPVSSDTAIELTTNESDAIVLPPNVVIRAGSARTIFEVQARIAGRTANIQVHVPGGVFNVRARTFKRADLVFTPANPSVYAGQKITIGASLNPPGSTETTIGLQADNAEVPHTLVIPAGGSGTFDVTAGKAGWFAIRATLPIEFGTEVEVLVGTIQEKPSTPTLFTITPPTGPTAGATTVDLTGANLRADCTLSFGGIAATTQFINDTSLRAVTPPHTAGTVDVVLICGADSSALARGFTFVPEVPRIESVLPAYGSSRGGSQTRISGANLRSDCWAYFGGVPARSTELETARSLLAGVPAHAAGTVDVSVRCGTGNATASSAFTFKNEDPSPEILSISPMSGSPGETVTISGVNFHADDAVALDAKSSQVRATQPETKVVVIPEVPAGKSAFSITSATGLAATSGPVFTVLEPLRPRITKFAPASAPAGSELVLSGEGFRSAYSFEIGGFVATVLSLEYDQAVVRISRDLAAGAYDVHILNSAGNVAVIGPKFTVTAAGMAIHSVTPNCGTSAGGWDVTISGSGFTSDSTVTFDGIAADSVAFIDAFTLRARVPANEVGATQVQVRNSAGSSATLSGGLRYRSPFDPNGCAARSRSARH